MSRHQRESYDFDWLLYLVKDSARKKRERGRECDVTMSAADIAALFERQGGACYYTGVLMEMSSPKHPLSPSVDRIDSAQGYTPGNCVLCCHWVNLAKNTTGAPEFIANLRAAVESFASAPYHKDLADGFIERRTGDTETG